MKVRMRSVVLVLIFLTLVACCSGLLLVSRTRSGDIYSNLHPWFMPMYLVTSVFLGAIIMLKGESRLKMSFIMLFSVLSCLLLVIVLDAGYGWDSWVHLGFSRLVYDNVLYDVSGTPGWRFHFSVFPLERVLGEIYRSCEQVFQYSISVIFARSFGVDVYWVHLCLIPMLWGAFVPVVAYSVARALCKEERAALISSLLVISYVSLIGWGSYSVPQSLGYIFFFFTLYLLLGYLSNKNAMLPAIVGAFASFLAHYITGIMAFAFILLAFGFRNYQNTRRVHDSLGLMMAFVICFMALPLMIYAQRYFYPITIDFSLSKLSQLSVYDAVGSVILTGYGESTIKQFITYGVILDLFGIVGLLKYGLRRHKEVDNPLCVFLLLAFSTLTISHIIQAWFMVGEFSIRLGPCKSLVAIPLAGIVINSLIDFLSPSKKSHGSDVRTVGTRLGFSKFRVRTALVMTMFVLSLSGLVTAAVYQMCQGKGVDVSGYELEAARYIDETTNGAYVVICDTKFMFAGYSVAGIRNPQAYYPYVYGSLEERGLYGEMRSNPSPEFMIKAAKINNASFGYFVVSIRSASDSSSLKKVIERSSIYFERYGMFGDGGNQSVYVFRYKIPPLFRVSPDISAVYWENPPSYIIQNDLMRVLIPGNESLEVEGSDGKLYESIDFTQTLVDGYPLGEALKVEYFDADDRAWISWNFPEEVCRTSSMKQQSRFKLSFDKVALVAVVERGKPFTQLCWESLDAVSHNVTCHLRTPRYALFSISGLTDSANPGSVHSRRYGAYYTVARTGDVSLHYAYNYDYVSGNRIYPYALKDYCKFTVSSGYLYYDLYVDNEANVGQWVYIEAYLPNSISGGVYAPFQYSMDNGNTWTNVYDGPLKTVNGTEVNWVISSAKEWGEKPRTWASYLGGLGGTYSLPSKFIDSGGCWNRIIFGMYLLGDTNPGLETSSGKDEGDQALIRIGVGRYGRSLDATYVFEDSAEETYGLGRMNNVFLSFYAEGTSQGGVTFTRKLTSLNITATTQDQIDHVTFDVPCNTTFSLLANEFVEHVAYESLARLSYTVLESDNRVSLTADVTSMNDWGRPAEVTICIPFNYAHEGGEFLFDRGSSHVLRVEVTDDTTETITIYPK